MFASAEVPICQLYKGTAMIKTFATKETEALFKDRECPAKWQSVAKSAFKTLRMLNRAQSLNDLAVIPGNRLEKLHGDMSGRHSIRVNNRFRATFRWENGEAFEVKIEDYH